MADCCHTSETKKAKIDFLLWACLVLTIIPYVTFLLWGDSVGDITYFGEFSAAVYDLTNKMFWGMLIGILFVGVLEDVPQDFLIKIMGKPGTKRGILQATVAGVLLDLCSHGILLVGSKLYKRGLSLGQMVAFLIASPWNSLSLTLVLWSLMGFWWMMSLLVGSMLVAWVSGVIFDMLVKQKKLPENPQSLTDSNNIEKGLGDFFAWKRLSPKYIFPTFWNGLLDSRMILRWLLLGMVLAAAMRTFVPMELFQSLFGPTLIGLGLTLLVATVLEVCSEGSAPIAADILTRAAAPGNAFAFLMAGVSTDYTEILVLRETTKSWKVAFTLPLVTLPQIVLIALLLNQFSN